jgi:hypothetical protein
VTHVTRTLSPLSVHLPWFVTHSECGFRSLNFYGTSYIALAMYTYKIIPSLMMKSPHHWMKKKSWTLHKRSWCLIILAIESSFNEGPTRLHISMVNASSSDSDSDSSSMSSAFRAAGKREARPLLHCSDRFSGVTLFFHVQRMLADT